MAEEEAVVIVGPDGKQVDEGESGTILRGEDAEKYLDGEDVSIPGVGVCNIEEGVVKAEHAPGVSNTEPDSPAARSRTAIKKGEAEPDEEEDAPKSADKPADKSRTASPKDKADEKPAPETRPAS